jgi:hypothetical protein
VTVRYSRAAGDRDACAPAAEAGRSCIPKLGADHPRVLKFLASGSNGSTEALMLAHGFGVLAELILAGVASADTERIAGGKAVNVRRFRIAAAGRVALER